MGKIKAKGKKIAEIRIKKGLTVRDLSNQSKVNIAVISKAENGITSPNPRAAKALADALNVDFDELFEII